MVVWYENNKLLPGILAHRVGAVALHGIDVEKRYEPMIQSLAEGVNGNPVYLSITDFNGLNYSINTGWGLRGMCIETPYGKRRMSVVFNYSLNEKLRRKDLLPDSKITEIVEKIPENLLKQRDYENTISYFKKEISFKRYPWSKQSEDDALISLLVLYFYDKFRESNQIDHRCKVMLDYMYDPSWGITAYEIQDNGTVAPFQITKQYIDAFLLCKLYRKQKQTVSIKLVTKYEQIPVYLME